MCIVTAIQPSLTTSYSWSPAVNDNPLAVPSNPDSPILGGSDSPLRRAIEAGPSAQGLHPTEEKYPEQCAAFKAITSGMYRVHLDKNADYSPYNINATGEIGVITRIWDKVARLMSLSGFDIGTGEYKKPETAPLNESIEDTLLDLANYAIIAKIHREGKWGK